MFLVQLWYEYMSWSQMLGFKIGDPSGMCFKSVGYTVGLIRSRYHLIVHIQPKQEKVREALRRKCPDVRLNIKGEFRDDSTRYRA